MVSVLPTELQQEICLLAIGPLGRDAFSFTAMQVCKTWAMWICKTLYRRYRIDTYFKFVGLVKTVTSPQRLLPYGSFIHALDLTALNKYGIDMRAAKLIHHCVNLRSIKLGHPTSVKTDTIQMIARRCSHLHTLEMGGLESWPFMLYCDFSLLTRVRSLAISTTPLESRALFTFPPTIEKLRLHCLDALTLDDLSTFLKNQPRLRSLAIQHCRYLRDQGLVELLHQQLGILDELELVGDQLTDEALVDLCMIPAQLQSLRLTATKVTDVGIQALLNGCLHAKQLIVSLQTQQISKASVHALSSHGCVVLLS